MKSEKRAAFKKKKKALGLSYIIDENPPWYICIFLGFQVIEELYLHCRLSSIVLLRRKLGMQYWNPFPSVSCSFNQRRSCNFILFSNYDCASTCISRLKPLRDLNALVILHKKLREEKLRRLGDREWNQILWVRSSGTSCPLQLNNPDWD